MKVLESGKITLYEKPDTSTSSPMMMGAGSATRMVTVGINSSTGKYYCLSKSGAQPQVVKLTVGFFETEHLDRRKAVLLNLLADNPDLATKFANETKFNLKIARSYIQQYNASKSGQKK